MDNLRETTQELTREMTWGQACARRLARHGLVDPVVLPALAEQVGVMCGAHAQVMGAAELSVGLRVAGATRQSVRDALWTDRSLVKTFGPRGTIHLLPSADLGVWTAALDAIPSTASRPPAEIRMSEAQADEVIGAMADALAGDETSTGELTADELNDAIVARTGAWAGELVVPAFQGLWPRWRQVIHAAAHRGVLCFGPNRGRNVTYTSPARWLPGFEPADPEAAIAEVIRGYLHAYGPATSREFAQWIGANRPWAAGEFEAQAAAGRIEAVSVDGIGSWVVAGDTVAADDPPRGVRLLPYFDAYAVGCHPREQVFPGRAADRALVGGQAGPVPTLVVDGVVAGVWHQRRAGRTLVVTVESFKRLTAARRRELDDQVERLGEVVEATPELTMGDITAASHW